MKKFMYLLIFVLGVALINGNAQVKETVPETSAASATAVSSLASKVLGKWEGEFTGNSSRREDAFIEFNEKSVFYKLIRFGNPVSFTTEWFLEREDLIYFIGPNSGKKFFCQLLPDGTLDVWRQDDPIYRAKMKRVM